MKPRIHASTRIARAFTVASLFSCLSPGSLFAADGTWTSTTGGNWSNTANWSGTTVANGTGAVGTFSASGTQTVTLDTDITVGSLAFSVGTYTLAASNGSVLTLATSTGTPNISSTATISAPLAGTQGFTMNPGGSRALTLSGNNTYTGVTALSSGGRINVQSDNALGASGTGNGTTITYSDNAAVQIHFQPGTNNNNILNSSEDITLRMNATGSTSVGAYLIYNDTSTGSSAGTTTLKGTLVLDRTAAGSTGRTNFFGIQAAVGAMNIEGQVKGAATAGQPVVGVIDPTRFQLKTTATNANLNVSGEISDGTLTTGGLSVYTASDNLGTVRLSGNNLYTGSTVHQRGTLLINNTTGSGTGVGAVTVTPAQTPTPLTATFGGTGIIAPGGINGVTFNVGSIVAPGDVTNTGVAIADGKALTFNLANTTGNVTFASGALISIDLNALSTAVAEKLAFTGLTAGTSLASSGDVAFNGNVVNFSVSATALQDGLYTIATFDADYAYSGNWVLGSGLAAYAARSPSLIFNPNSIQLLIGSSPIPEPSTFAMLGGLAALAAGVGLRRRRK